MTDLTDEKLDGMELRILRGTSIGPANTAWLIRTIREQAKKIDRLRSFVERCAEGEHPDEIPEEAREMLND